jgi:hypothetical protein
MSDRRETVVNVERQPIPTHTVYKERESGSGAGVLIGVLLAALVIAVLAFVFWPASAPIGDTNVTVETPTSPAEPDLPPLPGPTASEPAPAAPNPTVTEPAPATPPAASAPESAEPSPPEPETPPAPAPAQ